MTPTGDSEHLLVRSAFPGARLQPATGCAALAVRLVLGAAGTAAAIDWGKKELSNEQISVKVARETVKGGYGLVLTDELKGWVDAKRSMLIVDTMPKKDSYDKQHIPGAVAYCGFAKCGRSHNGAVWAKKLGYTNVVRYVGGIKAWNEADYPVEKTKE